MSGRKRNERGAFLPEYALVFAAFALGLMGVVGVIHERISDFYQGSSSGIGAVPDYEVSPTTLGWSPTTTLPVTIPTTTTTTTTTTLPTTTSTTSTSSTTSTTITTTPTTLPATTSTLPSVHSVIFQIEDRSELEGDGDWQARARVTIHRSDNNAVIEGAVVTGTFVTADGATQTRSCTTNTGGKCELVWGDRKGDDDPTTFTVDNVSFTPGWDGVGASITLEKP